MILIENDCGGVGMDRIKKHSGFTTIELVITIVVLAILASFVIARMPGPSHSVSAQANLLASNLRSAQNLSMTKYERYRLVIAGNSYYIADGSGSAILMPSGGTSTALSSGTTFGTLTNMPNNLIAFGSKGVPYNSSSSSAAPITAAASIVVSKDGQSRTVTIAPETGRVNIL